MAQVFVKVAIVYVNRRYLLLPKKRRKNNPVVASVYLDRQVDEGTVVLDPDLMVLFTFRGMTIDK